MAGTWASERFPQFESAIRQLTEQHRQLKDEPLHLALSYGPDREQQDIFLLEVIGGNGDRLSDDRELFETVFNSTSGFPMSTSQRLHLVLTTPAELETALREGWPSANEIRRAVEWGDYRVLHTDEVGQRLLDQLQPESRPKEEAARG
jgi:hypothetical protein